MVKFVNGREEVLVPETFTADVAAVGVCKRLQVCYHLNVYGCACLELSHHLQALGSCQAHKGSCCVRQCDVALEHHTTFKPCSRLLYTVSRLFVLCTQTGLPPHLGRTLT